MQTDEALERETARVVKEALDDIQWLEIARRIRRLSLDFGSSGVDVSGPEESLS